MTQKMRDEMIESLILHHDGDQNLLAPGETWADIDDDTICSWLADIALSGD